MYQFLDHPSEALVEVIASSVNEVFQDAALALFDLMTDLSKVEVHESFQVELDSPERHLLLIDWLNRLILLHEVEGVFLSHFDVYAHQNAGWLLGAIARGERIRENHERRLHVKSATYGQLEWKEEQENHIVRFLVDI